MEWRKGGRGRWLQGGGACLEYIIWSLLVSGSVFVSSPNFTALGFVALRLVSGIKLGDFSSLLCSHFLEIPRQSKSRD